MMPAGTPILVLKEGTRRERGKGAQFNNIAAAKVVAAGYRQASDKAHEVLEKVASKISIKELDTLKKVGMTSMSSKSASGHKELLADIAVKAVTTVAEQRADGSYFVDDDNIQIVKKQGGSIADTALVDGIIVDKERVHPGMPSEVKDAKIALVDAALEVKKTEIDAKIEITDPTQLQAFLNEEEAMLKRM